MFSHEKDLFEELMKCIDVSDKKVSEILNGGKEEQQKNSLVVFTENVEEFMGFDGKKIGGFEKGQVANIPREIAQILIEDKKAELIEK